VYELFLLIASTCPATLAERHSFTVCYDTAHQRPLWTLHTIQSGATPPQRKHWRKDHTLNSLPSAAFTNTGYHRGHLAAAADLPESQDTFLTSNAIAQDPALNTGPWRAFENRIRMRGPATVLTGAIYNRCGNERIEAPCVIYKIARFPDGEILTFFAVNAPRRP
jgi:DNA/RNA endonuclease G (NUC1)